MTPNQLLNLVTLGFPILLHDDPVVLDGLLKRALIFYQSAFGYRKTVDITVDLESSLSSALPTDCLQRICLTDSVGRGYYSQDTGGQLRVDLDDDFKPPAQLMYFVDLANYDYAVDVLPAASLPMLQDYLDVLIRIPNNELKSAVAAANDVPDPTVEDHATLLTRKKELEAEIRAAAPPLPMSTF